jgi:hypothetical protein
MSREEKQTNEDDQERLRKIFESDDAGLLAPGPKLQKASPNERLQRAFLEIVEFTLANHREPSSTSSEVGERKLGVRLEGIRYSLEKIALLRDLDELSLLSQGLHNISLDDLLEPDGNSDPLGLLEDATGLLDMSALPKSSRTQEIKGDVAQRVKCQDFEQFEPLFSQKHEELAEGLSRLIPFRGVGTVRAGAFFVLSGLMVFVAEVGDTGYLKDKSGDGRKRERLRLIFENGTESAMYRQSLAIRLTEGIGGFEVVPAEAGFELADDVATGWVYVLRSRSDDLAISGRQNLHKIGFTTNQVSQRIANAVKEPTYLMAPVEVIAQYRTYNVKASALEHLLHRVFADARLDISQVGPDGRLYDSTEWFEVPLAAINQAIALISTGEIVDFIYDVVSSNFRTIKH